LSMVFRDRRSIQGEVMRHPVRMPGINSGNR
jgi:hypothetical protein